MLPRQVYSSHTVKPSRISLVNKISLTSIPMWLNKPLGSFMLYENTNSKSPIRLDSLLDRQNKRDISQNLSNVQVTMCNMSAACDPNGRLLLRYLIDSHRCRVFNMRHFRSLNEKGLDYMYIISCSYAMLQSFESELEKCPQLSAPLHLARKSPQLE